MAHSREMTFATIVIPGKGRYTRRPVSPARVASPVERRPFDSRDHVTTSDTIVSTANKIPESGERV